MAFSKEEKNQLTDDLAPIRKKIFNQLLGLTRFNQTPRVQAHKGPRKLEYKSGVTLSGDIVQILCNLEESY